MNHATLPSSTSAYVDALSLAAEATAISSTTSSDLAPLIDPTISENKEAVLLATSEENVSPPGLRSWEKPEKETDIDSESTPSVARSFVPTQSPETVVDVSSESPADLQSDSSSESFTLVSSEAKLVQEMFLQSPWETWRFATK